MKPFYSFIAAAVVLSLPVTSTALRGQVLSASTPVTAATGDAAALTTGTEVLGIQVYGSSTLSNGVAFDWRYSKDVVTNVTWSLNGAGGNGYPSSVYPSSVGLSNQFDGALSQTFEGGSFLTITINGLTPGQVYVDQLFAAMTNDGNLFSSTHSATETVTDTTPDLGANNPSTILDYGQAYGNTTGTYFVTDTFTAPSNGIEILSITGASNDTDLFNAFQVRELPEPSTWAMMLAGLVFLGFRIRRRSIFRA